MAYYPYALATFSPTIENSNLGVINNVGDLNAEIKVVYDISSAANLEKIELLDLKNNSLGELNFNNLTQQNED